MFLSLCGVNFNNYYFFVSFDKEFPRPAERAEREAEAAKQAESH